MGKKFPFQVLFRSFSGPFQVLVKDPKKNRKRPEKDPKCTRKGPEKDPTKLGEGAEKCHGSMSYRLDFRKNVAPCTAAPAQEHASSETTLPVLLKVSVGIHCAPRGKHLHAGSMHLHAGSMAYEMLKYECCRLPPADNSSSNGHQVADLVYSGITGCTTEPFTKC